MGTNNIALEKKKIYKFVLADGTSYIINIDSQQDDKLVIAKNTFQKFEYDNVFIHEQRPGQRPGVPEHRFQNAIPPGTQLAIFTNNIVSITIMNEKQYKVFKEARLAQEKNA